MFDPCDPAAAAADVIMEITKMISASCPCTTTHTWLEKLHSRPSPQLAVFAAINACCAANIAEKGRFAAAAKIWIFSAYDGQRERG